MARGTRRSAHRAALTAAEGGTTSGDSAAASGDDDDGDAAAAAERGPRLRPLAPLSSQRPASSTAATTGAATSPSHAAALADTAAAAGAGVVDDWADQLPLSPRPPRPPPEPLPDHSFKVLLVGESGVGKTSLLLRLTAGLFEEGLPSTVGVDFATKTVESHGRRVRLQLWDTAGQERFRSLSASFYTGASGVVLVYDVLRPETLRPGLETWLQELGEHHNRAHPDAVRLCVANKIDRAGERRVTWAEGAEFARQHGCLYVETSAKANVAVDVALDELVLRILETPALLLAADNEAIGGGVRLSATPTPGGAWSASCSC